MLFWALILPSFFHAPEESSLGVSATQALKRRSSRHGSSEDIVECFILEFLRIPCLRAAGEILGPDLRSSSTSIAAQRTNRPSLYSPPMEFQSLSRGSQPGSFRRFHLRGVSRGHKVLVHRTRTRDRVIGSSLSLEFKCSSYESQALGVHANRTRVIASVPQPLPLGSGVLDVTAFCTSSRSPSSPSCVKSTSHLSEGHSLRVAHRKEASAKMDGAKTSVEESPVTVQGTAPLLRALPLSCLSGVIFWSARPMSTSYRLVFSQQHANEA